MNCFQFYTYMHNLKLRQKVDWFLNSGQAVHLDTNLPRFCFTFTNSVTGILSLSYQVKSRSLSGDPNLFRISHLIFEKASTFAIDKTVKPCKQYWHNQHNLHNTFAFNLWQTLSCDSHCWQQTLFCLNSFLYIKI